MWPEDFSVCAHTSVQIYFRGTVTILRTFRNEKKSSFCTYIGTNMHKSRLHNTAHMLSKHTPQGLCAESKMLFFPPVQLCGLQNVLSASEQFEFQIIERSWGICLTLSNNRTYTLYVKPPPHILGNQLHLLFSTLSFCVTVCNKKRSYCTVKTRK